MGWGGGGNFELVPRRVVKPKMTAISVVAVPFRAFRGFEFIEQL